MNYKYFPHTEEDLQAMMEKAGVVGAAHGSKPREVLIQDDMSLEALLSTLRNR